MRDKPKAPPKPKCDAGTPICSGQLIASYCVNGSSKQGKTFHLCGPCKVYLGKTNTIKLAL